MKDGASENSGARKRREIPARLLAAALKAQSVGVFIAEARGGGPALKVVFANGSFCKMTGFSPSGLVGRDFSVLHSEPSDVKRVREWLPHACDGNSLVGEGFVTRADGSALSAAWNFDPFGDGTGEILYVVATYRDQTERRRLQESLLHAQRLEAVGRLAGGVAHDFNNLLSVINGYCEILAGSLPSNPQAIQQLAEIHGAGQKAAALTQQLLAFSRRQPLDARVLNLNDLVRENAEILGQLIGNAGTLELDLAEDLDNVRTDAGQFQQVLLNLVINARDVLRAKGRILVSTRNREVDERDRANVDVAPGRYVTLTVEDNGTGMDTETMNHLFEPFFTTKPEGKGTGLGLALVYGVVQQSGGTISVHSELLVGSRFEILLPASKAIADAPNPRAVAPLPSVRGNETVWIVEPDDLVRKMVAGMLTTDGYRVVALHSAGDAPREPGAIQSVHLLIAGTRADDEKLARRLAAETPESRLIVIGEHESDTAPADLVAAGHFSRLNKPYSLSELLKLVRRLLDAS